MKKNKSEKIAAALVLLVLSGFSSMAGAETLADAQKKFIAAQSQYGLGSPETAVALIGLAAVNEERGSHQRAVTLYRRAGAVAEKIAGPGDPFLLAVFNGLGTTYEVMKKYAAADSVYAEVRNRGYAEWADQMEFRADVMRHAEMPPTRKDHSVEQNRSVLEEKISK